MILWKTCVIDRLIRISAILHRRKSLVPYQPSGVMLCCVRKHVIRKPNDNFMRRCICCLGGDPARWRKIWLRRTPPRGTRCEESWVLPTFLDATWQKFAGWYIRMAFHYSRTGRFRLRRSENTVSWCWCYELLSQLQISCYLITSISACVVTVMAGLFLEWIYAPNSSLAYYYFWWKVDATTGELIFLRSTHSNLQRLCL